MILLLDNYDSFSYNLYQLLCENGADIEVYRNDKISLQDIKAMSPQAIIIFPRVPKPLKTLGFVLRLSAQLRATIPIFGVCLGHQAICEAFGGRVGSAPELMHGKQDTIELDTTSPLFANLPRHIAVARYHSLCAWS